MIDSEPDTPPPPVSVLTPTHNRAQLLRRAMASVLSQTWREFEWIVVDDGSTDETAQVLAACTDPRLKCIRLDPNKGVAAARNAGIRMARGNVVAFLDDDDEYLPDYLGSVLDVFGAAGIGPDVVWTGVERVFERSGASAHIVQHVWDCQSLGSDLGGSSSDHLEQLNMACGLSVRRESLLRAGLFDESMKVSEDIDLLLRLGAAGCRFRCLTEILIRVHIHLAPSLSRSSKYSSIAACNSMLVEKNRVFLEANPKLWMHFHDMLAGDYYRAGERGPARKLILQMLCRMPWRLRTLEKLLRFEFFRPLQSRLR